MTIIPVFVQEREWRTLAETKQPSFQASGRMLSHLAAFPFFKVFKALFTSAMVTFPVSIAIGLLQSNPAGFSGAGLFNIFLKMFLPSVELVICPSQDHPVLVVDWCTLNISFPTEQPRGIVYFLHVSLFRSSFVSRAMSSILFILSLLQLLFTSFFLKVVNTYACSGQLLISCLSGLHLGFQLASLLQVSTCRRLFTIFLPVCPYREVPSR